MSRFFTQDQKFSFIKDTENGQSILRLLKFPTSRNQYGFAIDPHWTGKNQDKELKALDQCRERAKLLREILKAQNPSFAAANTVLRKVCGISETATVTVEPIIVTGIEDSNYDPLEGIDEEFPSEKEFPSEESLKDDGSRRWRDRRCLS